LVALDGADHLLLDESAARYAAGLLAAWAGRYLDPASPGPPDDVLEGWVRVRGASGLGQAIDSARHHWLADEPRTVKGATDRGPTPYDLLLSALGACKAMTMRLYADRKGWPLRATTIDLRHGHVHAKDCADCEKEDRRLERIDARISLRGDLDPEQRQRLLEIAGRCPVHRTLTGELAIEERLTED
jgi:putative redox protein